MHATRSRFGGLLILAALAGFIAAPAAATATPTSGSSASSVPRTLAKKRMTPHAGGRLRASNGVELRVPPNTMRRSGMARIRRLGRSRFDIHIAAPWKGTVTVLLPLSQRRRRAVAHQLRGRWVVRRAAVFGGRLRLRVRSLSVFDTREVQRYAVETMDLSYPDFLARKDDFRRAGCDTGRDGCRKPSPYNSYNWTDDGCSPSWVPSGLYRNLFNGPCQQHDFGYRNFGNGPTLGRDEDTRAWIDRRFREEMQRLCRRNFASWWQAANKATCLVESQAVWGVVRGPLGRRAFYRPRPFPEPGVQLPQPAEPAQPLPNLPHRPQEPIKEIPPSTPARRVVIVDNRVTNGMGMREDATPARLLTKTWTRCTARGCNISGTERTTGQTYDAAVCQTFGERTTNGHDSNPSDDANPSRFESTRYYGVRLAGGTFGYVSETWIRSDFRGGLGLPGC